MASRELQYIISAKDNATRVFSATANNMGTMSAASDMVNKKLLGMGGAATLAGGLMLKSLGGCVSAAREFGGRMTEIWSVMDGSSKKYIDSLGTKVLDMSLKIPQAATTLAEGLYQVTSAGFAGAEGLKVVEQAAKLATAGLTDTGTTTDVLAKTLNAYDLSAANSTAVSDVLFKTVTMGMTRMSDLAPAWTMVAGLAASAGIKVEELGAAFATLTKQGLPVNVAGTAIRGVISSLMGPSEALTETWGSLSDKTIQVTLQQEGLTGVMGKLQSYFKIQTKDIREVAAAAGDDEEQFLAMAEAKGIVSKQMKEMFPSVRALIGFLNLMSKDGATYNGMLKEMKGSQGATERAFKKMSNTIGGKLQVMKNAFFYFKVGVGQAVLPLFSLISDGLKGIGILFAKLPKPIKTAIAAFLLIGGVTLVVGGLIAIFGALKTAIWTALAPALPYIAGFVAVMIAVAAVVALVRKHWDELKPVIMKFWISIKGPLNNFKLHLIAIGKLIKDNLIAAWKRAQPIISKVLKIIWLGLKEVWKALVSVWNNIKGPLLAVFREFWKLGLELWKIFKALWPVLKVIGVVIGIALYAAFKIFIVVLRLVGWVLGKVILPAVKLLIMWYRFLAKIVKAVATVIGSVFKFLWKILSPIFRNMSLDMGKLGKVFFKVWNGIAKVVDWAWRIIKKAWNSIGKPVVNFVRKAWDKVKLVWTTIWSVIRSALSVQWKIIVLVFKAVFGPFILLAKIMWKVIQVAWKVVWTIISQILQVAWGVIRTIFNTVFKPLISIAAKIWEIVKSVWQTVWGIIKSILIGAWNWIVNTWHSIIDPIVDIARRVWDSVSGAWSGMWASIKGGLQDAWNWVVNTWHSIIDPIVNTVSHVWDGIKGVWDSIWGGIKRGMKDAINAIIGIMNGLIGAWNKIPFHEPVNPIGTLHTGGGVPLTGPYILEGEEYVINKKAAQKLGKSVLNALNVTGQVPVKLSAATGASSGGAGVNIGTVIVKKVNDFADFERKINKATSKAVSKGKMLID